MDWADRISALLSDERLLFNAIGVHAAIAILLIVSVIVRGLLQRGVAAPAGASDRDWLKGAASGAVRQACRLISWSTTLLVVGAPIVAGIAPTTSAAATFARISPSSGRTTSPRNDWSPRAGRLVSSSRSSSSP